MTPGNEHSCWAWQTYPNMLGLASPMVSARYGDMRDSDAGWHQFSLWTKSRGPVLPVGARAAMPSSPGQFSRPVLPASSPGQFSRPVLPASSPGQFSRPVLPASSPGQFSRPVLPASSPGQFSRPVLPASSPGQFSRPVLPASSPGQFSRPVLPVGAGRGPAWPPPGELARPSASLRGPLRCASVGIHPVFLPRAPPLPGEPGQPGAAPPPPGELAGRTGPLSVLTRLHPQAEWR